MRCLPLDEMGATIFFQLVSARYERGSIILTSNKSHGDDHLDERELYFETASNSPSAQVSGGFEIVSKAGIWVYVWKERRKAGHKGQYRTFGSGSACSAVACDYEPGHFRVGTKSVLAANFAFNDPPRRL